MPFEAYFGAYLSTSYPQTMPRYTAFWGIRSFIMTPNVDPRGFALRSRGDSGAMYFDIMNKG